MDTVLTEDSRPREELLEERLTLFFRSLGIKDESAIRLAVQQIQERLAKQQIDGTGGEFVRMGMFEAMSAVRAWVEQLLPASAAAHARAHDLLLWRLRNALRTHPEFLFSVDPAPETVQAAIRASQAPAIPGECHTEMPVQPLGDVPVVLRSTFWKQLAGQCSRFWTGLAHLLTRERKQT